ncbi:CAF17-like 4Fe-4S cluster assembly/insertion protein YgfZ [Microbacterium halophytorum]|uniref:CAF17-like 4Fe-4S cluster assembly/insertion protein YgfZ n=1 Tax=Microbacterium halophytorum TaxID=2067568 RepID=UPI000CFCE5EF|nr:glycine cleavage T C-terminal barrel domain-containing protein [Microbacterium halophytorum]
MGTEPGIAPPYGAGLAGAVVDGRVVAHFGDPVREQRALAAGSAAAVLGDRAVIAVRGEDRLSWLDSITSQSVSALGPGESTELLVLSPQGHVEHAAAVYEDGETVWLIADAGDVTALAKWLTMMRFRSRVEVSERGDLAVVGFAPGGAAAEAVVPLAGGRVWRDPWSSVSAGGWQYAQTQEHPGAERAWCEAVVDPGEVPASDLFAALEPAGAAAAEALRIAAWRPRWSGEVDEKAIPHESDWLRSAVHLNKGCYRGQETVAKVHNLGHPPRRLVMLHLDGSESVLPARGDAVSDGEREAGRITSAARHHELGPIALAVVSRRTPAEAALTVATQDGTTVAASQEVIVPADAGATAEIPRLTRLSRRPLAQ